MGEGRLSGSGKQTVNPGSNAVTGPRGGVLLADAWRRSREILDTLLESAQTCTDAGYTHTHTG